MRGTILRKIRRASELPPEVLISKIRTRMEHSWRKQIIEIHPVSISDRAFLKSVGETTAENLIHGKLPNFFIDIEKKNEIILVIKTKYTNTIEKTILDADAICDHIFDLLGSGKFELGQEIDWHKDFKSGFQWNHREYFLGTGKYINFDDDSDVKVPWEMSRCQHFITLGKAYWYTENERYAEEFVSQIESWIRQNPVERGVNWACTMDVAIRAVNWIWAYYFFSISPSLKEKFRIKFLKSLLLHGRHISNNLEFGYIRGNHYLSDITGLIYLGILFQETIEGKKWLEKGLSALKEEMDLQIYPDGVNFEGSISYHRLVAEEFLSATILCLKNGITFPEWYTKRLEKMIEFVMYYTKPDGAAPQIGDNDDGRLHILSNYGNWNKLDHRYLLSIGAALFKRQDFRRAAGVFHEEAFWLIGDEGLKSFEMLQDRELFLGSKAFAHSGFYIMRDANLYMIIDCGSDALRAPLGHKHNSKLSFELFAYDKSFIIDPGTYIYTADKDKRNLFRSTRYHNTVVVDGEEQNRFDDNELFAMKPDAAIKVNKWLVTEKYDFLDAEHVGYTRLKNPIVHQRQISFYKDKMYWIIKDILTGKEVHKFDLYFHFAAIGFKEKDGLIIKTDNQTGANIIVMPLETEGVNLEIEKGWVSYGYGKKIEALVAKYTKTAEVPVEFVTVITTGKIPLAEEIEMNMKSWGE